MKKSFPQNGILDRLVWISILLGGFYWLGHAALESFLSEQSVIKHILYPDLYTFLERSFVILPLILFSWIIRRLVHERTRAVTALEEKERSMSTLLSHLPGMAYRCKNNREWTMEFLSEGCHELTGYPPDDLLENHQISYNDLIHPEDRESVWEEVQTAIRDHRPFQHIYRIITASRSTRWVWEQGQGVFSPDGKVEALEGFISDITDRKTAEEALTQASNEWRITFDATQDIILMLDGQFNVIKANSAACRFFDKPYEQLLGKSCLLLFPEDEEALQVCPVLRMEQTLQHEEREIFLPDKGIWVLVSVDPIFDQPDKLIGAVQIIRDITHIKEMEKSLREAKEEWEETFNIINDAITIHDKEFNIIRANPSAEEMLGLPLLQMSKKKCYESYHGTPCAPEGCPSCRTLQTGIPSTTEIFEPHLNKFIEIKALPRLDDNRKLIGLVHVVRDISDRKKSEEEQRLLQDQLIQAQKMESIGNLAGGVAHDFNNMLSAILGYNELSLDMLPEDHPVRENLLIIHEAGEKAAALTRQLLAFGRKQILEMKPVNLNVIVENMSKMLSRLIGEDIVLEFHTQQPVKNVLADAGQIEQILMNLAVNARDAIGSGGHLIIETSDRTIDGAFSHPRLKVEPGAYVQITVSDTGEGIPREVQEKIFEPFFTTKERDKGTGLGLATVYGIVKQHRGWIWVYSEEGIGTTFKILLPSAQSEIRQEEPGNRPALQEGTETILVVEDDEAIGQMIRSTLKPLGYRILSATCADEALTRIRNTEKKIDLVLSDVIMPGMNGVELAEKIQTLLPNIPTILMSGYTDNFIAQHGVLNAGFAFLQKPITPTILTNKIRKILDHDKAPVKIS